MPNSYRFVQLNVALNPSAMHRPLWPLKGTVQLDTLDPTAHDRCADQVSAMVERLIEARQEGRAGLSQQVAKREPVTDYGQVLNKLYEARAKLPQASALFILKTGGLNSCVCECVCACVYVCVCVCVCV